MFGIQIRGMFCERAKSIWTKRISIIIKKFLNKSKSKFGLFLKSPLFIRKYVIFVNLFSKVKIKSFLRAFINELYIILFLIKYFLKYFIKIFY
jgi:hypothetical protein